MADLLSILSLTELFADMAPDEIDRLTEVGRVEYWPKNSMVLEEGAYGPRMLVLLEGKVEVLRKDKTGGQRQLAEFGEGEVLGEMSLLLDLPRAASVRALTDLKVFAMDRVAFKSMVDANDPAALKLGLALSRILASRLMALNDKVVDLLHRLDEVEVGGRVDEFAKARQELFSLWDY